MKKYTLVIMLISCFVSLKPMTTAQKVEESIVKIASSLHLPVDKLAPLEKSLRQKIQSGQKTIDAMANKTNEFILKAGDLGVRTIALRYNLEPSTIRLAASLNLPINTIAPLLRSIEKRLRIGDTRVEKVAEKMQTNLPLSKNEVEIKKFINEYRDQYYKAIEQLTYDQFNDLYQLNKKMSFWNSILNKQISLDDIIENRAF